MLTVCGLFIRSLYSPLVESFVSAQRNSSYDLDSFSKIKDSRAWDGSSPTTTSQHDEQSGAAAYKMEEEDKPSQLAPQATTYGDAAPAEKLVG